MTHNSLITSLVGAGFFFGCLMQSVGAAIISCWNFNDSNLTVDVGNGTITPALQAGGEAIVYEPGTTLSAQPGVVAGNALGLRDLSPGGGFYQVIGTLTFSLSTVGFSNIQMQLNTFGSAAAPWNTSQITYSFSPDGGITFAPWGQTPAGNGTFTTIGPINFSSVYDNNPNMRMRINFSPFGTTNGYIAFDNVTFTGTPIPEPTTSLTALTGLSLLLLRRRRRDAANSLA